MLLKIFATALVFSTLSPTNSLSDGDHDDTLRTLQEIGNGMLCGSLTVGACTPVGTINPNAGASCGIGLGVLCEQTVPDVTEEMGEWIGGILFKLFGPDSDDS